MAKHLVGLHRRAGKQHRFFEMVAHNPAAARRVGISVGYRIRRSFRLGWVAARAQRTFLSTETAGPPPVPESIRKAMDDLFRTIVDPTMPPNSERLVSTTGASTVTEIPLALEPRDRGVDLPVERVREIAGRAVRYRVTALPDAPTCLCEVAIKQTGPIVQHDGRCEFAKRPQFRLEEPCECAALPRPSGPDEMAWCPRHGRLHAEWVGPDAPEGWRVNRPFAQESNHAKQHP